MNDMAGNEQPLSRRASRSRRALLVLAVIGTLPILALIGGALYLRHKAVSTLRHAIAEADRLDPGWRLADLEAKRKVVPEERNSADQVQAALAELPKNWLKTQPKPPGGAAPSQVPRGAELLESLDVPPDVQLSPEQIAGLRAELGELSTALAKARALAEMPEGRPSLIYARVWIATLLPHAQEARQIARLLQMDATLRAHGGDIDGALDSCRALMNTGRSIGDEPIIISQLVRIAIDRVALATLQRVLAQGEASDESLARVQALIADEARHPFLLTGLRGERAGMFDLMGKLLTGEVSIKELSDTPSSTPSPPLRMGPQGPLFFQYNQGLTLDFMNRAVEIAKRPAREQPALWNQWKDYTRRPNSMLSTIAGTLAYLLTPATDAFGTATLHVRAQLDCGETMVALERYRLAHGHWPESLDKLVPSLLPRVPDDPYAPGPLRFLKRPDGVVIYSVGEDGQDNGGTFPPKGRPKPGTDQGYRLWDVAQRRKPAETASSPVDETQR